MDSDVDYALERMAVSSDGRRDELLVKGARKSAIRKALNLSIGLLTLLSAGSIGASLTQVVGKSKFEIAALMMSIISGLLSLVLATYFADDEAVLLNGAADYLVLREAIRRSIDIMRRTGADQSEAIETYSAEYARLDRAFSKHLSAQTIRTSKRVP